MGAEVMKAVMISIQPKWVAKILSGEKTVEVRKTAPKLKTPFRCYIYETQGKTDTPWIDEEGHTIFRGRGQVVAEFICKRIRCTPPGFLIVKEDAERVLAGSCLTRKEVIDYVRGNDGKLRDFYGWHISELKIYDRPISIGNFKVTVTNSVWSFQKKLERPPQSWCYVEE